MTNDEEIKQLRARASELRAKNEATAAARAEQAELERLRREAKDEEGIARALGEHPDALVTRTDIGAFVTKRPHAAAMRRFIDKGASVSTASCLELVRGVLTYPSADVFDAVTDRYPAFIVQLASAVFGAASARVDEGKG